MNQKRLEAEYVKAEAYRASFKNDSATLVLNNILTELEGINQLETPFGLRVQLRAAEALERDHQDEKAIEQLLNLAEVSTKYKQADVQGDAHLSLARLYEKLGRKEDCLINLRKAESTITQNKVDSLYPRFAIRLSSYHRMFENRDSAEYYAMEVLRTAPRFGQFELEATGHMLMGLLYANTDYQKAIKHLKAAGKTWFHYGDYSGYGGIMMNLSRIYKKNGQAKLALIYNDSAIMASLKAIDMGMDNHWLYSYSCKERAYLFKELGQADSAWYYLEKGYRLELDRAHKKNTEKALEIDARYKDEKKTERIIDQAIQLKEGRRRRHLFIGISLLFFIMAAMLTYYYLRLRKAKERTEAQALTLRKVNSRLSKALEKQIILQGEVHHRVKNNMQVIISLLELQKEEIEDHIVGESFTAMSNRIYSMSAIHEILYQEDDTEQVNFHDYVEILCSHFSKLSASDSVPIYDLTVGQEYFNLETCMPLGIMLTELLTNSLKYARLDKQVLQISIGLKAVTDGYKLIYKDNGPGFPQGTLIEREGGLGSYLLKSMSRQLSGYLLSKNEGGAITEIFFKEKNKRLVS